MLQNRTKKLLNSDKNLPPCCSDKLAATKNVGERNIYRMKRRGNIYILIKTTVFTWYSKLNLLPGLGRHRDGGADKKSDCESEYSWQLHAAMFPETPGVYLCDGSVWWSVTILCGGEIYTQYFLIIVWSFFISFHLTSVNPPDLGESPPWPLSAVFTRVPVSGHRFEPQLAQTGQAGPVPPGHT